MCAFVSLALPYAFDHSSEVALVSGFHLIEEGGELLPLLKREGGVVVDESTHKKLTVILVLLRGEDVLVPDFVDVVGRDEVNPGRETSEVEELHVLVENDLRVVIVPAVLARDLGQEGAEGFLVEFRLEIVECC